MNDGVTNGLIAKILPTWSVAFMSLMGLSLQEWTYVVAIMVGIVQMIHTVYCTYKKWKEKPSQGD